MSADFVRASAVAVVALALIGVAAYLVSRRYRTQDRVAHVAVRWAVARIKAGAELPTEALDPETVLSLPDGHIRQLVALLDASTRWSWRLRFLRPKRRASTLDKHFDRLNQVVPGTAKPRKPKPRKDKHQ